MLCLLVVGLAVSNCSGTNPTEAVAYAAATGGNPQRGRAAIVDRNCGACHTIPGVREAQGKVGPPLFWWSRRGLIAGEVPNTPANLVQWVRNPQSIEPNTAMPALGLSDGEARDVAAYLFTLR
jgi:mono/diheme cytochrome c family protein